jgi:hypothetical protein
VLRELGEPAAARPLLERALAIDEAAFEANHPTIAVDLSNLALVLQDLGDPAAARPLLERTLAILEARRDPRAAIVRQNLADVSPASLPNTPNGDSTPGST